MLGEKQLEGRKKGNGLGVSLETLLETVEASLEFCVDHRIRGRQFPQTEEFSGRRRRFDLADSRQQLHGHVGIAQYVLAQPAERGYCGGSLHRGEQVRLEQPNTEIGEVGERVIQRRVGGAGRVAALGDEQFDLVLVGVEVRDVAGVDRLPDESQRPSGRLVVGVVGMHLVRRNDVGVSEQPSVEILKVSAWYT